MAYSKFQVVVKFIRYYLSAFNGKGHGIHSPFVYEFAEQVLNDKRRFYAYTQVESLQNKLFHDHNLLKVEDPGAGSAYSVASERSISSIARQATKSRKLAQLLFRIVHHYLPGTILELGTSLGLSTAYMALANPRSRIISIEGVPSIAAKARQHFELLALKNIQVIEGNFDDRLPPLLEQLSTIDLAFIDGNHREEPTLAYFNQLLKHKNNGTIFIFDDIHWSEGMESAWEKIKNHPEVKLTIDLFFFGLVFFREEFRFKQHFYIRF